MIAVTVNQKYTISNALNVCSSYQLKSSQISIFIFIFNSVILTFPCFKCFNILKNKFRL